MLCYYFTFFQMRRKRTLLLSKAKENTIDSDPALLVLVEFQNKIIHVNDIKMSKDEEFVYSIKAYFIIIF